jgi:hypothetical protein
MNKQVNNESTFSIAELEQRLEMSECKPGSVDLLGWLGAPGTLCSRCN